MRKLIVPGKVEKFDNEKKLKEALEDKKHKLVNTRIFYEDEIFYHYDLDPSGGGNYNVFVTFAVTDAKNKLILPYPKYDSNTGLVLGLRYKDKNFMGLYKDFSIIFDAKQHNSSYEKGDFYVEMPFEEIKVKDVSFSGSFEAELDLFEKMNDYVLFDIKERGFKIAGTNLNAESLIDFNHYNGSFRRIKYGLDYGKLMIGQKGFFISAASNMNYDWRADHYTESNLNETLTFGNIPIKNLRITNTGYIKFRPKNFNDFDEGIARYQLKNTTRFAFTGKWSKLSFGSDFNHYKDYDACGDYLETTHDITHKISSKYTLAHLFMTKWKTKKDFTNLILGKRLTVNSTLFSVPYTFTIAEFNDFSIADKMLYPYFQTTLNFSYDKINYKGNFRRGHQFSVNSKFEWHPWNKEKADKTVYFFNIEALSFPAIFKFPFGIDWFNPFFKLKLIASSKEKYWTDDSSLRLSRDDIRKLFRGIRSDNKYVKKAYDSSCLIGAFNINLMSNLFEFEDFGWTYLNLFWDAGIIRADSPGTNYFDPENRKDYKILSGAGFEIICIMNSHPGYPIRASLGLNTEKLYKRFIEKDEDVELEYEVYIGIGFAY